MTHDALRLELGELGGSAENAMGSQAKGGHLGSVLGTRSNARGLPLGRLTGQLPSGHISRQV